MGVTKYPNEMINEIRAMLSSGMDQATTARQARAKFPIVLSNVTDDALKALCYYYAVKIGVHKKTQKRRKFRRRAKVAATSVDIEARVGSEIERRIEKIVDNVIKKKMMALFGGGVNI